MKSIKKILVATDFSPESGKALAYAQILTRALRSTMLIVSVEETIIEAMIDSALAEAVLQERRIEAKRQLDKVVQRLRKARFQVKGILAFGRAAEKIVQAAR